MKVMYYSIKGTAKLGKRIAFLWKGNLLFGVVVMVAPEEIWLEVDELSY